MKKPKKSLELSNPTRNTHTFANKLMTVASGEINSGGEHKLICHVLKVKAPESAYSRVDQLPFLGPEIIPSNPTL